MPTGTSSLSSGPAASRGDSDTPMSDDPTLQVLRLAIEKLEAQRATAGFWKRQRIAADISWLEDALEWHELGTDQWPTVRNRTAMIAAGCWFGLTLSLVFGLPELTAPFRAAGLIAFTLIFTVGAWWRARMVIVGRRADFADTLERATRLLGPGPAQPGPKESSFGETR